VRSSVEGELHGIFGLSGGSRYGWEKLFTEYFPSLIFGISRCGRLSHATTIYSGPSGFGQESRERAGRDPSQG
jgi:hypothetical protein